MADPIIEKINSELEDSISDIEEYRIIPYPADYTLQGLFDKWNNKEIILPKFQRQFVWKLYQASRLIESFLMGLPVPGIFLYKEPESQILSIIDGHQRLKSVFSFFNGIFPGSDRQFRLFKVSSKWESKTYKELEPRDQIKLRDAVLRAIIVEQIDPDDDSSIFHIFERLNTGGTPLTSQEIRNCIFHGTFNDFLIELNKNSDWRKIFGSKEPDNRMRDVELILRFLALYYNTTNYSKPMKEFISRFMKYNRNGERIPLEQIEVTFSSTMRKILENLGERPFNIRAGLNAAVFDAASVAFARNIDRIPADVVSRYNSLIENSIFLTYISAHTTDVEIVNARIKMASDSLFS